MEPTIGPTGSASVTRAIAATPGNAKNVDLATLARPSLGDVADGLGARLNVLRELFDRLQNSNGAINILCEVG